MLPSTILRCAYGCCRPVGGLPPSCTAMSNGKRSENTWTLSTRLSNACLTLASTAMRLSRRIVWLVTDWLFDVTYREKLIMKVGDRLKAPPHAGADTRIAALYFGTMPVGTIAREIDVFVLSLSSSR